MVSKEKRPEGKQPDGKTFRLVRTAKSLILGVQNVAVLALAALLIATAGYSADPLYIPLGKALNVLLVASAVIAVELIVFRALEIKHAPQDGRRFMLVNTSLRAAKRTFAVALLVALLLAAPPAHAVVTNVLSTLGERTLSAGESYPITFNSQDALGITRATELRVAVQSGALRVRVADETGAINGGGTILSSGDQYTLVLPAQAYTEFTVTFENLAGISTGFTYRIVVKLPPGFILLTVILSTGVAAANLVWLFHLVGVRKRTPLPDQKRRTARPSYRMLSRPVVRPWYNQRGLWQSSRRLSPRGSPKVKVGEGGVSTAVAQEMPPPPDQVDPYEVDRPVPPSKELPEDAGASPKKEPGLDISAVLQRAQTRVSSGEYQAALEDYEAVLNIDTRSVGALLGKADLLRRLQRRDEALRLLDEILQLDPWDHKALLCKGRLLEDQGEQDEALRCYEAILRGGPHVLDALVRKGSLLTEKGEHGLAVEAFQEALRLDPENRELEDRVRSLEEFTEDPLEIARREAEAGNKDRAERFYRRALKGKRASEARLELIEHHFADNREERCLPLLDDAITEDPEDHDLRLKKAKALLKVGRPEDALRDFERASEMAPELPTIWSLKGALEADLGHKKAAIDSLEKAITMNPDDEESGRRLEELRRQESDAADLEEVLRTVPDIPEEAINSILEAYGGVNEVIKAKVKALSSLDGVSEDIAKSILKKVRTGG